MENKIRVSIKRKIDTRSFNSIADAIVHNGNHRRWLYNKGISFLDKNMKRISSVYNGDTSLLEAYLKNVESRDLNKDTYIPGIYRGVCSDIEHMIKTAMSRRDNPNVPPTIYFKSYDPYKLIVKTDIESQSKFEVSSDKVINLTPTEKIGNYTIALSEQFYYHKDDDGYMHDRKRKYRWRTEDMKTLMLKKDLDNYYIVVGTDVEFAKVSNSSNIRLVLNLDDSVTLCYADGRCIEEFMMPDELKSTLLNLEKLRESIRSSIVCKSDEKDATYQRILFNYRSVSNKIVNIRKQWVFDIGNMLFPTYGFIDIDSSIANMSERFI